VTVTMQGTEKREQRRGQSEELHCVFLCLFKYIWQFLHIWDVMCHAKWHI